MALAGAGRPTFLRATLRNTLTPSSAGRFLGLVTVTGLRTPSAPSTLADRADRSVSTAVASEPSATAAAVIGMEQLYCLAVDGEARPFGAASEAWLRQAPRGAYTTARTVGGDSVFELTFHINRLAESARLMLHTDQQAGGPPSCSSAAQPGAQLTDPALLRPRVMDALRAAVTRFRALPGVGVEEELKLTLLVTWPQLGSGEHAGGGAAAAAQGGGGAAAGGDGANDGFTVYCHVQRLPPRPRPPVKVQVRGAPRDNAAAKDSEWVRQRASLNDSKPSDVNEILLVDAQGRVLEGMSSNFFAVVGGTLQTAEEGVLKGTVREVVLQVCAREGIPVVLQPPQIAELPRWEAALVSSTSRLALPVDELQADLPGLQATRTLPRDSLAHRLDTLVLNEIAACSENIF